MRSSLPWQRPARHGGTPHRRYRPCAVVSPRRQTSSSRSGTDGDSRPSTSRRVHSRTRWLATRPASEAEGLPTPRSRFIQPRSRLQEHLASTRTRAAGRALAGQEDVTLPLSTPAAWWASAFPDPWPASQSAGGPSVPDLSGRARYQLGSALGPRARDQLWEVYLDIVRAADDRVVFWLTGAGFRCLHTRRPVSRHGRAAVKGQPDDGGADPFGLARRRLTNARL